MAECQRYKVLRKAYTKARHKRAMTRNRKWFFDCLINGTLEITLHAKGR